MAKVVPEKHLKGWGYEIWITNKESYCGKILVFRTNKKFSWHYHKIKDETFFINSGSFILYHSWGDDLSAAEQLKLNLGDIFHVPAGLRHQLVALEESSVFEISTQHFEQDSYRITKGD